MLSSGCNVHECRVLLPERVRIALRHLSAWGIRIALRRLSAWGIRMELIRIAWRCGTFHIRNSVRRHFTSGYLTAGWERRMFQFLRIDISGPSDSAYLQSFSLSIQCNSVLLKLPDIFDRHFEIFWDILL